jgi:hypothetical protein
MSYIGSYSVEWEYEQKEGFFKIETTQQSTVIEILRFLSDDNESNLTYVRVFAGIPTMMSLVKLSDFGDFTYLVDGEKP